MTAGISQRPIDIPDWAEMTMQPRLTARRRLFAYSLGFLRQARVRRILALAGWDLRLGWPEDGDRVAVWGQRPASVRGRWVARRSGAAIVTVEDGFLRSVRPGVTGAPPLSLIVDDLGIYYDATRPSRLERILDGIEADPGPDARTALRQLRAARLSKYSPPVPPRRFGPGHVLVVDQTRGDASIRGAGAGAATFRRMLQAARSEHPGRQLIVKSHPDVVAGTKPGHFDTGDLRDGDALLGEGVNAWDAIDGAAAVYTVSSQMGYEAILAGVPVRTFGHAFYSGWGLTHDERRPPRRGRNLTALQLFVGAHLRYPVYYDPWRDRLCGIETVIVALEAERRADTPADAATGEVFADVRRWKRRTVARFRPSLSRRPRFAGDVAAAARIARGGQRKLWVWASRASTVGLRDTGFVEDGFLRSVGLGAALHEPASLVFDRQGIYFDPSGPSDLEDLIARAAAGDADTDRAARLRRAIVATGITKYNVGVRSPAARPSGRPVVLVPGQVEDDASVLRGCGAVRGNLSLLRQARASNPDAWLIWKPHPDVEAGLRAGAVPRDVALGLADEVAENTRADDLLTAVDEVWTLTSLIGFEALVRGKVVTCLGAPFYSGWGLTSDLGPEIPRRLARPTLDELVWAVLIAYPLYRDPLTGLPCGPELVVERFAAGIRTRQANYLSKLQSVLSGQAWRWRR